MFIVGKLKLATSVFVRLGFRFLVISYNEPLKVFMFDPMLPELYFVQKKRQFKFPYVSRYSVILK